MRSYIFDFNEFSRLGYEAVAKHEVDGWNAAQAGMDTGRNANHLIHAGDDIASNMKRSKDGKSDDLVDVILTQAAYNAVFADTMNKILKAETAVDRVLDLVATRLAQDEAKFDAMIERLPTLEDGTSVAKSEKDGMIYTLDGVQVDPDIAALVPFTGHEESLEAVLAQEQAVIAGRAVQDQAIADQHRLGEIREEMDDKPEALRAQDLGDEAKAIENRNAEIVNTLQKDTFENAGHNSSFDFTAAQPLTLS